MTKEQLKQMLKDNLRIQVSTSNNEGWMEVEVKVFFDNEVIAFDSNAGSISTTW